MPNSRSRFGPGERSPRTASRKARSCCRSSADRLAGDSRLRLPFGVCIQNQLAEFALRRRVDDRPKPCETAPLAVHVVLARRERDVAPTAAAAIALPDGKA